MRPLRVNTVLPSESLKLALGTSPIAGGAPDVDDKMILKRAAPGAERLSITQLAQA